MGIRFKSRQCFVGNSHFGQVGFRVDGIVPALPFNILGSNV
jgi:hypothetical protein